MHTRSYGYSKKQCFSLLFLLILANLTLISKSLSSDAIVSSQQTLEQTSEQADLNTPKSNFVFDSQNPTEWLKRLAHQTSHLSYEVSFVLSQPGQETQPYLWRHAILDDNTKIEQLTLLNGPGFEHIRFNSVISLFEPGFPAYSIPGDAIKGPIPSVLLTDPEAIKQGYEFVLVGRNRVSGRAAQQLRIIPRDKTRYGYHIWLDEDTGMLLKLNMYDLKGVLLEQIQVTQLTISNKVKTLFESVQQSNLPKVITMKNPPQRDHEWKVGFLPVGMKQIKQDIHRLAITGQIVEYSMLSDGLIDVSVYIQQASEAFSEDVEYRINTKSVLSRTNGRVQVTIVGEIPLTTAASLAESIVLVGNQ